ncbi:sigma-54 dependent transcriptional regulator [Tunturiibacter gelidoferens]|uniref:DNA-binding NtrC family response regulator n=1 Tax=Tunturiibacter gelidiferens TaxID=3069689 RepID=A0ACC5P3U0_9BACT|nr:sigma-54 dependent transcriptional regulator [Edaphobacter lichenicola]MBB5341519.1 DNA-binding NtrC family response regulator [Edaphobacter lichenicola]
MLSNAGAQESTDGLKLLFATSDNDALPEIGQELAPAFFIRLAADSETLFQSLAEHKPEILVIDLDTIVSPGTDVFCYIESIRAAAPHIYLTVISRTHLKNARIRTKKSGADEFLLAPIGFPELRDHLLEAGQQHRRHLEAVHLRGELARRNSLCDMIGGSEPMQRLYETLRRVASSHSTVLLRGESGTGKELAARAIVDLGPRRGQPFISVNCAALPETLMESELFGHEKGAFTGAHATQLGQIELADSGTLFLDEIGSLPLLLQSKLLRVLQEKTVQRIGAKSPRKIDFRLIAATNDNLDQMVRQGQFREDLFYRICVIPVALPPLRDREGDIPLLLDHYLTKYCTAGNLRHKRFSPEALQVLETGAWPGNVRELENLVQRLALMVDGDTISMQHLPEKVLYESTASYDEILVPPEGLDLEDELTRIEVAYLLAALRRAGGKTAAAALLHIPVEKMKYLCRKHRIHEDQIKLNGKR